jgi:hypothetical protein
MLGLRHAPVTVILNCASCHPLSGHQRHGSWSSQAYRCGRSRTNGRRHRTSRCHQWPAGKRQRRPDNATTWPTLPSCCYACRLKGCVLTGWTPRRQVVLVDRAAEQLERAIAGMRTSLCRLVKKGALSEDPEAVLHRLQHATDLEAGVKGTAVPCIVLQALDA